MADFLEERLCVDVRIGASYADDYAVEISQTAGGAEHRRLVHGLPRRSWSINFTLLRADLASSVLALYHRAYGRYAGFRVRCEDDYSTAIDGRSAPSMLDQSLLYISSGVYQLRKQYGIGAAALSIGRPSRTIYKPVSGTVVIAKNGVLLSSGVTVNTATGRVTISPAPLITDAITGGCEFDVPARFDSAIEVTAVSDRVRDCGSISLIELLQP